MVASSAMFTPLSEFCLQAGQQVSMHTGIDFLAQNLLGPLDSQCGNLLTQGFAGLDGLLLSFDLGGSNDLAAFLSRLGFGVFNQGLTTALGFGQAYCRLVARFAQFFFHALVGHGKFGLGFIGSGQAISDFLSPLVQRFHDGWPHKFHCEPHQNRENNRLNEQGCVNTHGNTFLSGFVTMTYFSTKGLANANIIAIPTPIRNAASIRPASRNILVCSSFISSGWRAAASRYL